MTFDCARDLPLDPTLGPSNEWVGVFRFRPDGAVVQTNSDFAKAGGTRAGRPTPGRQHHLVDQQVHWPRPAGQGVQHERVRLGAPSRSGSAERKVGRRDRRWRWLGIGREIRSLVERPSQRVEQTLERREVVGL